MAVWPFRPLRLLGYVNGPGRSGRASFELTAANEDACGGVGDSYDRERPAVDIRLGRRRRRLRRRGSSRLVVVVVVVVVVGFSRTATVARFVVVSFSYDLPGHREEGGESNAHVVGLNERLAVFGDPRSSPSS